MAVGGALIYSAARGLRPPASVQVARADRGAEQAQAAAAPIHSDSSNTNDTDSSKAAAETPLNGGETLVPVPEPSGRSHSTESDKRPVNSRFAAQAACA